MKRFLIALACLLFLFLPLELKAQGGQSQPIRYGTALPTCNASTKYQFFLLTSRTLFWCNGVGWTEVGAGIGDIQVGTATPTISLLSNETLIDVSNATPMTITLPQPNTGGFTQAFWFMFHNSGPGTLSFSPTGSNLNGSSNNITVGPGTWGILSIDFSNNWRMGFGSTLPSQVVSGLPTASLNNGYLAIVTDGINSTDCTVGGGNKVSICRSNGATYVDIGSPPQMRTLGWSWGDVATGSALTTSEIGYVTVPFACTITGWHIMADAGTVTIKTARVNGGTALPTVGSNSISTSGVALASGTKIDSTTVTDFTSTTIATNDTLGFFITAVATAKQITFQLDCVQ